MKQYWENNKGNNIPIGLLMFIRVLETRYKRLDQYREIKRIADTRCSTATNYGVVRNFKNALVENLLNN